MPVIYRDGESSSTATMAIVLVVALFALLIGYFAWWRPSNVNAEPREHNVIVTPSNPAPSNPAPSVIPIPMPGPSGASGPAGPAGPAGPSGPSGPSAPAAPAAPAAPSDSGSSTSP